MNNIPNKGFHIKEKKMKKQIILYTVCLAAMMSSCHIYKSYDRPEVDTQGLYRDPVSDNDTLALYTTNLGNLPC